nr:disease resistance protein RPP13-like isoform X6 [Ipomoea batatas]
MYIKQELLLPLGLDLTLIVLENGSHFLADLLSYHGRNMLLVFRHHTSRLGPRKCSLAALSTLPRLEVLKLDYDSCVGKQWELPEDDKFCQLIVLEINSTHLKDWKATGDNFPKLEHLYLFSCTKLKEIPKGFAEISKLKSIQLVDCRPSVVASAEEIKEEQLDYLNNIVDVVVAEERGYSSVSESESESDEYESDEA